jgi:hypothetical protein
MAITNSISLHIRPENIPREFQLLVDRMLASATLTGIQLREKYWHYGIKRQYNDLYELDLGSLTEIFLKSDKALEIDLRYRLKSGRTIAVSLALYGQGYEEGYAVMSSGNLKLSFSHSQLAYPLKELLKNERMSSIEELSKVEMSVLSDAKDIFLQACGLDRDVCSNVEHAAMYLELGWPSPLECSMIFHHKSKEFAIDFLRIYAEYKYRISILDTFDSDFALGMLGSERIKTPNKTSCNNQKYYRRSINNAEILTFLHTLSEEKIKWLLRLPEEVIVSVLTKLNQNVTEIECHSFRDCGMILVTNPLLNLLSPYKYIYSHLGSTK